MRMSRLNTATTEQMGYDIISFFCVLAPEGMNPIVFGRVEGEVNPLSDIASGRAHLVARMPGRS